MDINLDELIIKNGISDIQIDQLSHHTAHDSDVHRFTQDKTRFSDRAEIEKWKKRASAIYTLSDATHDLLGLIWFEHAPIPHAQFVKTFEELLYTDTFAIRLYAHARGKRLAGWFMQRAFARYPHKNVWLKTSFDNHPAVRSYTKFGFGTVTKPDNNGKIIMILP